MKSLLYLTLNQTLCFCSHFSLYEMLGNSMSKRTISKTILKVKKTPFRFRRVKESGALYNFFYFF